MRPGLQLTTLLAICLHLPSITSTKLHLKYKMSDLTSRDYPDTLTFLVGENRTQVHRVPLPKIPVYFINQTSSDWSGFHHKQITNQNLPAIYTDRESQSQLEVRMVKDPQDDHTHLLLQKHVFFGGRSYTVHTSSRKRRDASPAPSSGFDDVVDEEYEATLDEAKENSNSRDKYRLPPPQKVPVFKESNESDRFYEDIKIIPSKERSRRRRQTQSVSEYFVDIALVLDYSLYQYFYDKAEDKDNVFDDIYLYYAYYTSALDLHYQPVRIDNAPLRVSANKIVIATTPEAAPFSENARMEYNFNRNNIDIDLALPAFNDWTQNAGYDVMFPNDHAVMLTNYNFMAYDDEIQDWRSGVVGFAYLSTLCRGWNSVSLVEESAADFYTVDITAHEIGHSLGSQHDGKGNSCDPRGYIMAQYTNRAIDFSSCSVNYFRNYIERTMYSSRGKKCLTEKLPVDQGLLDVGNTLPGHVYSPDEQCRMRYGNGSYFCRFSNYLADICFDMYCYDPSSDRCRRGPNVLSGTPCGDGKMCLSQYCREDDRAIDLDEMCPFGDQKGEVYDTGMDCYNLILSFPGHCSSDFYYRRCCDTCSSKVLHTPKLSSNIDVYYQEDKIVFTCNTTTLDVSSYQFLLNDMVVFTSSNNLYTIQSATLEKDEGAFSCVFTKDGDTSRPSNTILVSLGSKPKKPILSASPNGELAVGTRVELTCTPRNTGNLEFKILKDGVTWYHGVDNTLVLPSVSDRLAGTYTCIVVVDGVETTPSDGYILVIGYGSPRPQPPTLSVTPSGQLILPGTSIYLVCTTSTQGTILYTFLKGSTAVYSGAEFWYTLDQAQTSDTGVYTCVVSVSGVTSSASNEHTVTVSDTLAEPVLSGDLPSGTVYQRGSTVSLTCHVQLVNSNDTAVYVFVKDGAIVYEGVKPVFTIEPVDSSDSGSYTCQATVRGTTTNKSNIYTFSVTNLTQRPTLTVDKTSVTDGESITLTCTSQSSKVTSYVFNLNSVSQASSPSNTYTTIVSIGATDTAVFTCQTYVGGEASDQSEQVKVSVRPKRPTLNASPHSQRLPVGSRLILTCKTPSNTTYVTYVFYKSGTPLKPPAISSVSSDTFTIDRLETKDSGDYTCVCKVREVMSVSSNSLSVTVVDNSPSNLPVLTMSPVGPLVTPGSHVTFTCTVGGTPVGGTQVEYKIFKESTLYFHSVYNVMEIASVSERFSGTYFCVTVVGGRESMSSDGLLMTVSDDVSPVTIATTPLGTSTPSVITENFTHSSMPSTFLTATTTNIPSTTITSETTNTTSRTVLTTTPLTITTEEPTITLHGTFSIEVGQQWDSDLINSSSQQYRVLIEQLKNYLNNFFIQHNYSGFQNVTNLQLSDRSDCS